jgi:tetratricopeptide (TPR) repeat protein
LPIAGRSTMAQVTTLGLDLYRARLVLGQLEGILHDFRVAETLAEALDDPRRLGGVSLALAQYFVATHRDPPQVAEAEASYRQAMALAEELGMRPLQAHCHLGLGTLYAKAGQQEQAHAELAAAIDLHRAMEMTFWLPQAEAALAQAGEARRARRDGLSIQ